MTVVECLRIATILIAGRKHGPHHPSIDTLAGCSVPLALVVILALAACSSDSMSSAYLQANNAALHQGASATAQPTQFVVEPGASARSVAAQLQAEGLIKDAKLFEAYVRASGLAGKLQAGDVHPQPAHDAGADRRGAAPLAAREHRAHRPGRVAAGADRGWVARLRRHGRRSLSQDRRNGRSERAGCRRARTLQLSEGTSRRRHAGGLPVPRHL